LTAASSSLDSGTFARVVLFSKLSDIPLMKSKSIPFSSRVGDLAGVGIDGLFSGVFDATSVLSPPAP
jgi:hypothetical protein